MHCQGWWEETDQEGDIWMREKKNFVRRVPHHQAMLTHECEICTRVYWDGDNENETPTRECFMSSIPHVFSGEESQFGEMACSVTIPHLGNNQFIPGLKDQVKI